MSIRTLTQEDPIGLAGGLNLYGFAGGDPINFSDPFGLCKDGDETCQKVVSMLREQEGSEFQKAADRFDAYEGGNVQLVSGDHSELNINFANADGNPETWVGGSVNRNTGDVFINSDFGEADQLITMVHESMHLDGKSHPPFAPFRYAGYRAYTQLSAGLQGSAQRHSNRFFKLWGPKYGSPVTCVTEACDPRVCRP